MGACVDANAMAFLVLAERRVQGITVALRYDIEAPLAVRLTFPAAVCVGDVEAHWYFARALLEEGLRVPAGDGSVRFHPCGPLWTGVEFRSGAAVAVVLFDAQNLRRFLRETYKLCPVGRESLLIDVGRFIESLLRADGAGGRAEEPT
jgi:hypothetical protein